MSVASASSRVYRHQCRLVAKYQDYQGRGPLALAEPHQPQLPITECGLDLADRPSPSETRAHTSRRYLTKANRGIRPAEYQFPSQSRALIVLVEQRGHPVRSDNADSRYS